MIPIYMYPLNFVRRGIIKSIISLINHAIICCSKYVVDSSPVIIPGNLAAFIPRMSSPYDWLSGNWEDYNIKDASVFL